MIRVLQIIDGTTFGGIARVMKDISCNIKDVDIDYLTHVPIFDEAYSLDADRKSFISKMKYNYRLFRFLKRNKYDIVHINSAVFLFSFQCAIICKIIGVKIVVHSHNELSLGFFRKLLLIIFNPLYRKITDVHLSCSKSSVKSLFTKTDDVIILKNGIDVDKYKYNKKIRDKYRKMFNLNGKIVYGNTGMFAVKKNHLFLIDVFYELQKNRDCILLLAGDGETLDLVKKKVCDLEIEDKVIFLGFRDDVNIILQAMDVYLFPSLYEGLPLCLIEAQTSGLPVVVSDVITDEARLSSNFYKAHSLDDWVNVVNNIHVFDREGAFKNTIKNRYDVKESSLKLEKIYKDLIK